MRKLLLIIAAMASLTVQAAVPNRIVYQGRLFKSNSPVQGQHRFDISILRQDGFVLFTHAPVTMTVPSTGEFTLVIENITNVDWLKDNPKLKISVDGEELTPNEDFTATAFAFAAKQVDAGGVNTAAIQNAAVTDVKVSTVSAAKIILPGSGAAVSAWQKDNTGMIDASKIAGTVNAVPSAHGSTHRLGGSDAVTNIDRSQVSGTAIVRSTGATQIIQPSGNVVALQIKGNPSSTNDVLEIYDAAAGNAVRQIRVDYEGNLFSEKNITAAQGTFTNQSRARVTPSASKTISPNKQTKVDFGQKTFDTQNEFDLDNDVFTAKSAGHYMVSVQVNWPNPAAAMYRLYIIKNGSNWALRSLHSAFSSDFTISFTDVIPLSLGDSLKVEVLHFGPADNSYSGQNTFFTVHKIP